MSPGKALALGFSVLAAWGCGPAMSPRPKGPYQGLRLIRDLPAFTRIQASDFEAIALRPGSLPQEQDLPRTLEDVRGRTTKLPLSRGTFLRDAHLILQPVLPDPAQAHLLPGEWGMFSRIEGLPAEIAEGSWIRLERIPIPLRLAAVGIPSLEARPALLSGESSKLLEIARKGTPPPLRYLGPADCTKDSCPKALPPPAPPAQALRLPLEERQPVVVVRRSRKSESVLAPEDLQVFSIPKVLAPPGAPGKALEVQGKILRRSLAPGEILTPELVTEKILDPDPVDLAVDGLHPDWIHPGSRVHYLRCTEDSEPLELDVLDMKRGVRGGPVPLKVRPSLGKSWPRLGARGKKPKHGEGDLRAWTILVRRSRPSSDPAP